MKALLTQSRPATLASRLAAEGGTAALTKPPRDLFRPRRRRDIAPLIAAYAKGRVTDTRGAEIQQFEQGFAALCQSRHALTTNSGTAALFSAFFAVGVGPGDEVIVPGYTFFATAAPLLALGATPVFAEVDPDTMTLDVGDALAKCTARTKGICCVHVWGNVADAARLRRACDERGLALIEDASHAHGASLHGVAVGRFGDVGAFSCQGNKAVSGGELGVAVTQDAGLHERMIALGHFGRHPADVRDPQLPLGGLALGHKFRPHLYGVMLAQASLRRLPALNQARQRSWDRLGEILAPLPSFTPLRTTPGARRGGFLEFIFRVEPPAARAQAIAWLKAEGVPVAADRYSQIGSDGAPLFAHRLFAEGRTAYRWFDDAGRVPELPITEAAAATLCTLPAWGELSDRDWAGVQRAFSKVNDALQR